MNVFEKSKLHADRRELGTKKDHNITLPYTKIVQCFKHFQSCNSNKDQNNFYKGIYGSSIKSLERIIQPQSYRCIILYIQSPKLMYVLPGWNTHYPSTISQACLITLPINLST